MTVASSSQSSVAQRAVGTPLDALADYGRFVAVSYRSTFLWRSRFGYLSNVVAMPILFAAQFSYIGSFTGGPALAKSLAIGMTVYAVANIELSGIVQGAFHQKTYGTEDFESLAQRGFAYRVVARTIGHCGNGLISGTATLAFSVLVLNVSLGRANPLGLLVAFAVAAVAAACFGALLASLVPRLNDWVTLVVIGNGVLTGLCGVVVPRRALPPALKQLSALVPFSHAVDGFRLALAGASTGTLLPDSCEALALSFVFLAAAVMIARALDDWRLRRS